MFKSTNAGAAACSEEACWAPHTWLQVADGARRWVWLRRWVVALVCVALSATAAEITHQNYLSYVPEGPLRIHEQTQANVDFELFGDPAGDSDGDGINDDRADRLLELCDRFSPIL